MRAVMSAVCVVMAMGCQLVLDVEDPQCTDDADCVGLLGRGYTCSSAGICQAPVSERPDDNERDAGPSLPDNWACAAEPPSTGDADDDEPLQIRFDVVDYVQLAVPPGLVVKACRPNDLGCDTPIGESTPNSDGEVEFEVPYGFDGFFELTSDDFLPALSVGNRPFTQDEDFQGPTLVSDRTLVDIASRGDEMIDAALGTAILEILDCEGEPGVGVRFETQQASDSAFYFDGALPDRELGETTISTVLGRGGKPRAVGGFVNIKPEFVTFTASLADTGDQVSTITVEIRSGYMTFIRLHAGY